MISLFIKCLCVLQSFVLKNLHPSPPHPCPPPSFPQQGREERPVSSTAIPGTEGLATKRLMNWVNQGDDTSWKLVPPVKACPVCYHLCFILHQLLCVLQMYHFLAEKTSPLINDFTSFFFKEGVVLRTQPRTFHICQGSPLPLSASYLGSFLVLLIKNNYYYHYYR